MTGRMVRAQTAMELRLTLRRGESLLLTLAIPLGLLAFFGTVDVLGATLDLLVPGVLALAVMSTAMTGLAIATGFERQYGVLKRLGATPLPRSGLLLAKTLSVLAVEALQVVLIGGLGLLLGWRPSGRAVLAVALVAVGTAAFAGLGLLMAGTLRAEATLAAANGLYLVLLLVSGMVVPLAKLPSALAAVARLLPSGALAEGLRSALGAGGAVARPFAVLAVWAAASLALAARTFRWE
ncbi:MAG TPA: ABC transporter permease [Mycobacteriales bacterium]|nr:ABC transporter permease [Mycobacteriales bacterium]